ncbi:MAG: hypothetical protein AAF871_16840 [Pseudomonadota bacterium]
MLLRFFLVALLAAPPAFAGPYPRDTEGTVISITEDIDNEVEDGTTSIFVESGSELFSVGVDTEIVGEEEDWSAFAFIRRPLTPKSSRDRVSLSAGFGAQQTETGTEPVVVLGGAWGRDVEGAMAGWLSLEGEARYGADSGETALSGDAAVAVSPINGISLVNEVSVSRVAGSDDDTETFLTSSIVGTVSETARVQLGATVDLSGEAATGIRLGTWLEF